MAMSTMTAPSASPDRENEPDLNPARIILRVAGWLSIGQGGVNSTRRWLKTIPPPPTLRMVIGDPCDQRRVLSVILVFFWQAF